MLAWAQTTSSPAKSSSSPAAPTSQLKVRGPDAVAQQDPNRVVAVIDGKQITAQQAAALLKQVSDDQKRQASLADLVQQVYMVDRFSDQAEKLKLDQQSPWKERLQSDRRQIMAQAYVNQMGKDASVGSSTDAQQYYNNHLADFDQLKLSGIFVRFNPPGTPASGANVSRTEAEAQQKANDLEKKIKEGGDFSALARTESDDQKSSVRGGDLGTILMGDPVPPAIKAAVGKLQTGQVSEPVRVAAGYFILKVDSRTKLPFDQVRANIVQKLEFDKYKIQVQDPDFFASSAPTPNIPSLQRPASPQPSSTPVKPPGQ